MSKGFDQVEWAFLKAIMKKMKFLDKFITLIMSCITYIQYFIVVNRNTCGYITPTRGIWQGDPLSSYLFLFCSEGLFSLLFKANRDKQFYGYKASKNGPSIFHLIFIDDLMIFL